MLQNIQGYTVGHEKTILNGESQPLDKLAYGISCRPIRLAISNLAQITFIEQNGEGRVDMVYC